MSKKRLRWLGYHDQQTAGIMGLLPAVRGLPMRLTDTIERGLKLYKHRRCTLIGWTLHPDEASEVEGTERNLNFQPLCLYLKFEGAAWQVGDLEPGVYPLEPRSKDWFISEWTKVKAKRTGFQVVPDFSATAHMLQGASLHAVIADCLEAGHVSRLSDMVAAYVALSRAKVKENVLITQPFSPGLFAHGPPPGPHILMRLLRGEISADRIDAEFDRLQRQSLDTSAEKDLMRMHWRCQSCYLQGREDHTKPMAAFGVRCPADFVSRLLPQGAWARCGSCATAIHAAVLQSRNSERQEEAAALTHVCSACGEDLPKARFWPVDWRHRARGASCKTCQPAPPHERRPASLASEAVHVCASCGQEKRRCQYWPADWQNRHQNISCATCQPSDPSSRARHQSDAVRQHNEALHQAALLRAFRCQMCDEEKTRDEYWPSDLANRYRDRLGCKLCKPVPPNERRQQKKQAASATSSGGPCG